MCSEKISYLSEAEAIVAGQRRLAVNPTLTLFTYACPECGLHHLTKARKLPAVSAKLTPVKRPKIPSPVQSTVEDLRQKWGCR